jgi:exodeoxyribonuclease V alpha subunit
MARLFDAMPESSRVILLGDRDQLASVEAGHVLGDICAGLHDNRSGPLRDNICELSRNHRFGDDSNIYRLSRAIRSGDLPAVKALLASNTTDLGSWEVGADFSAQLTPQVLAGFRPYLEASTPADALAQFSRFRILTATRAGERSSEHLNQLTERILTEAGLIQTGERYYEGRPILIRRNDYNVRLFNGDIGIICRDPESGGLRAFFASEDGSVRGISPSRLPEHETAYAMTVHKSQGSEFQRVLVLLPKHDIPLLSRELLYTAATRAREHVELWWNHAALDACLGRAVRRFSGLRDLLWKPLA